MQKLPTQYKTIILDMDGTLYLQPLVRICIALSLALHYALHPTHLKELFALQSYRRMRESGTYADSKDFAKRQFQALSEKYDLPISQIESIIHHWMQERPIKYIRRFRDKQLITITERLRKNGTVVVLYSDYPVVQKAAAVGIAADYLFCAEDEAIACLKPDPKGLLRMLETTATAPQDALFVGDRYAKDGLCAKAAGVDYVILPKLKLMRRISRHSGLGKA